MFSGLLKCSLFEVSWFDDVLPCHMKIIANLDKFLKTQIYSNNKRTPLHINRSKRYARYALHSYLWVDKELTSGLSWRTASGPPKTASALLWGIGTGLQTRRIEQNWKLVLIPGRDEQQEKHRQEISRQAAGLFEWHQPGDTYSSPGSITH